MCVKENFEFETSVQKYLYGSLLNGPKNFVFKFDHIYKKKSIFVLIILKIYYLIILLLHFFFFFF
jgi:hypothetical protein